MSKAQRQHRVVRILAEHPVSSQMELVDLLSEAGIDATQATASRDLGDLGAVKVRVPGGGSVYAIPEHPADQFAPEHHLRRVMGEWVAEVHHSGNIVVLRTPPGSAHVVASAIDRSGHGEILGTVAGDDTILVVAAEGTSGRGLAATLRSLAGL